ncbi:hypothetical protein BDL97_16G065800 [Sphagnum fallax]|nr:hypothetical protein BDL97_16G065800 [Sphagnum fallax]KAH8938121.1 hypothetical protein BDL97_16G065800 [Sphagnum fallax]
MAEVEEYRCFVGGLSRNTTDQGLEDAFRSFGNVIDAKVITDKETGQPRGFGFVNFGDERSMEDAIESLHGKDLDGRNITVNRAKPKGRDGGDRGYSGGGGRGRDGGGGGGGGGGDCFKCGQPGHWARECPGGGGGGGGGGRYSSRDGDSGRSGSRYGDQGGSDRYGDRSGGSDRSRSSGGYGKEGRSENRDRDSGRNGAGGDRYGSGSGGGSSRYEGGSKDRSGPYDRPSGGSRSSHD